MPEKTVAKEFVIIPKNQNFQGPTGAFQTLENYVIINIFDFFFLFFNWKVKHVLYIILYIQYRQI